jgi:hypothetical protein
MLQLKMIPPTQSTIKRFYTYCCQWKRRFQACRILLRYGLIPLKTTDLLAGNKAIRGTASLALPHSDVFRECQHRFPHTSQNLHLVHSASEYQPVIKSKSPAKDNSTVTNHRYLVVKTVLIWYNRFIFVLAAMVYVWSD